MHVCYFFCVYVSFYCTFSSRFPFFTTDRWYIAFSISCREEQFLLSYFTGVFWNCSSSIGLPAFSKSTKLQKTVQILFANTKINSLYVMKNILPLFKSIVLPRLAFCTVVRLCKVKSILVQLHFTPTFPSYTWLQNSTPLENLTHKPHFPFPSNVHIKPCSQVPFRFWFCRHI